MVPLQRPFHPHKAQIKVPWWPQAPSVQGDALPLLTAQILVGNVHQIAPT